MSIRLLFFAALRDCMGQGERVQELPGSMVTIAQLRDWLQAEYGQLTGRLETVRFAVNEQFVEDEHALCDGDDVALIPPVSGG